MNLQERLEKTFKKEEVDRPPVVCPGGMMVIASREVMKKAGYSGPESHLNPEKMAKIAERIAYVTGFENVGVPFCMTVEAESLGSQVDLGDIHREPSVTKYACESLSDFARLSLPEPEKSNRLPVVLEAIRFLKRRDSSFPLLGNLVGPISLATSLIEPTVLFQAMRREPQSLHEILDFLTESLIHFGKAQLRAGADVIVIADPTATGEILGPSLFREFAQPYLEKLTNSFNEEKKPVIVHICGNVKIIADSLANVTPLGAFSFDSIVNPKKLKEKLPHLVLMGNVSTFILERSSPELVRKVSKSSLSKGICILSPACGISPKTPLENIRALTSAVFEYEPS